METLYNAIKKAVNQFGFNVLTEIKIINILSDFSAFSTLPAAKTIFKNMVENGYCHKICNLGRKKTRLLFSNAESSIQKPEGDEWKIKLATLATSIAQQGGFEKHIVTYVLDSIIYGLEWTEEAPSLPQAYTNNNSKRHDTTTTNGSSQMRYLVTTGTNTNPSNGISYQQIEDTQFVVISIKPYNAEVFIDGIQQYVANGVMATELPVGEHDYEIKAESYKSKKGSFNLSHNDKTTLTIQLELEEQKIALSIVAKDKDAEIWVNGMVCGQGMWNGLIDAGKVVIECIKPKFYSYTETKMLGAQQKEHINIPALQPICGNIKINVQPYGSEIFINGESKGTTPLMVTDIPIGDRSIRITSPEGVEYYANVEVKEGQVTNVNYIIPSLFLEDYSEVRIGDYFYEDGSISHEIAKGKEIVGMVFSLETSEEEKKQGWIHGQIIALHDASLCVTNNQSWGIPTNEIMQFAVQSPKRNKKNDNGYEISHRDCVVNNEDFSPFYVASKYYAPLPFGITSGWYLPSVSQWWKLYENMHPKWETLWRYLNLTGSGGLKHFATSSIMDKEYAWMFTMGYAEEYKEKSYSAKNIKSYLKNDVRDLLHQNIYVRCVAAF